MSSPPTRTTKAHPRLRRWLTVIARAFALAWVLACIGLVTLQRKLLYAPPSEPTALGASGDVEFVTTRASDGVTVHAAFLAPAPDKPTLVWFHGNAEDVEGDLVRGRELRRWHGFGSLAVEYRGYGLSRDAGTPSEQGLYADAEAAIAMLPARGVASAMTILVGRSLGSGVAIEMAARGRGAKLVLVSPYTSIPDVAATIFPMLPVHLLAREHFESERKAAAIELPTLIVHGDRDDVIPFAMGQRLSAVFPHARFVAIHGARHNDVYDLPYPETTDAIVAFAKGGGAR